jgi:hypothetical protein
MPPATSSREEALERARNAEKQKEHFVGNWWHPDALAELDVELELSMEKRTKVSIAHWQLMSCLLLSLSLPKLPCLTVSRKVKKLKCEEARPQALTMLVFSHDWISQPFCICFGSWKIWHWIQIIWPSS